jgi:hypothetical protein
MWVQHVKPILAALGLFSCSPSNIDIGTLTAPGAETTAPPAQQRQAIEKAVAQFANGRFVAGTPRWFIVEPGVNPISIASLVTNSLRDLGVKAQRISESGPDGADADVYSWKLNSQNNGLVAAVIVDSAGKTNGLAAYYPITISKGWNPPLTAAGTDG